MPNNEYLVTSAELTATADSIREKLGSQAAIRWDSGTGFKSSVDDIQTGGGGGSSDDVRFLDYDGTIVQTYSAADFANLSELPANPIHTGLTSQGWNWTLVEAKTYVASYGKLDIGQMYITDDGKTRIHIHLEEGRLDPHLGLAINGSADIDWGDGTAHSTLTGSSTSTAVHAEHSYASAGEYIIAVNITSGTAAIIGTGNGSDLLKKSDLSPAQYSDKFYQNAITSIYIGRNISIGFYAFYYCNSLRNITIPSGITSIGSYTFNRCPIMSIVVPSTVTSIEDSAFSNCFSLVSIAVPSSVTKFGPITHCYSLIRITTPPNLKTMINVTNCYSLTSITIPSGITSIGNSSFYNCYSLTSITIPSSVTSIGGSVFYYCYSLTNIIIPSSVTSIGNSTFSNCYINKVTLPQNLTSISGSLFQNCSSLTNIIIPSSVTSIGSNAFMYCYGLASIIIPSSVTSIGSNAFSGCTGMSFFKFLRNTPPTCSNSNSWSSIPSDCQIIYPYVSTVEYKSATNYPSTSTYLYLGFYTGTDGETLPTTVTDGTTTYNLTWYSSTEDAVAQTNPITTMQGTEVYCRSVLAA